MILTRRIYATALSVIALLGASSVALISQNTGRRTQAVIVDPIDENKLVTLKGNTRSEANADNDLGPVADSLPMESMMLQLKRTAAQDKAAAAFVDDLYNPSSANFHKWVPAGEFGKNFGVADADIKTITAWLESHGFRIDGVNSNGMLIGFSGDAGMVRRAFHTSIHNLSVNGVNHVANFSDPQIPAALAPAVAGIVSLHNFHSDKKSRQKYTYAGGNYAVVPADLAAIYDYSPLYSKGTSGAGQTIAVVEDTDLYAVADWNTFRSTFGLATLYPAGSLVSKHPAGSIACRPPGVNNDDDEAIIDVEWASASAPSATIVEAACADTNASYGELIATNNLIGSTTPPNIISISYGVCEAEFGPAGNLSVSTMFQTAAAAGISVFVSAGDEGAASCDAGNSVATHGVGVSAYASTPYAVAVGGTDFSDSYDGTVSKYWNKSNSTYYGSALSYIPEIPWNGSCASSLVAQHYGFSIAYGPTGFCASPTATTGGWVEVSAGSGGPSGCATGAANSASYGIVSGGCLGYSKPSWQTGLAGIPADGVRDIPDVSMFASNGVWSHYYVVCFSDPSNMGVPCTGSPSNWTGFGGTSVSAPVLAGIQALVNETIGSSQGNPNPVYYSLAAGSYASAVFHQISRGDITQNCAGTVNCYGPVGYAGAGRGGRPSETSAAGALSVSDSTFSPAYLASPASWNFATGIGSVDAANLVAYWPKH